MLVFFVTGRFFLHRQAVKSIPIPTKLHRLEAKVAGVTASCVVNPEMNLHK